MFLTYLHCLVYSDLQGVLSDDLIYQAAAKESFPQYNKDQMLAVELSDGSGHVYALSTSLFIFLV